MLSAVAQTIAGLKGIPDRAQTLNVFARSGGAVVINAIRVFDVVGGRLELQPQGEASAALLGQVPGDLRADHWAARRSRRAKGSKPNRRGPACGQSEREEWIMPPFSDPGGLEADFFRYLDGLGIFGIVAGSLEQDI